MNWSRQSPIFELFDPTLAETIPDVIGLWATNPGTTDAAVNFTLNSETVINAPLWRANFPSDLSKATLHLTHSEEILSQSQKALVTAIDRVHRLIHTIASEPDLAFDLVSVDEAQPQPERELLASLQAIQKPDMPTSFGIGEEIAAFPHRTFEQFQPFIERLLQVVAHYAWIETQVEGQTLAQTSVGWLTNVASIWQTGLSATQVSLHQRTLSLALASRDALLQIFHIAVQTALKLSVLVSVPGGLILVLPVAWQFINRIMTQLRKVDS
ncbi:MAG: hypothetical protein RMY64_14930 [Nostoc sp. DedQUE08]|uniref:hypothetical protein n=1 Tax=Nostoc sp. DedQUE08 TaxID=3075393 RepID=UPI002AD4ACB4|nr:hypothetical protein [Nostoc sp. DedQUE08]MDZ8066892.1 hypothetical protein [Nostoc sp. DedQUE08]